MNTQSVSLLNRLENHTLVRTVRNGLISMIPVLSIGAFALILKTFPVDAYQAFIASFAGGLLLQLFDVIYSATFGVLSVYMTYCISRAYMKEKADPDVIVAGAVLSSLLAFFIRGNCRHRRSRALSGAEPPAAAEIPFVLRRRPRIQPDDRVIAPHRADNARFCCIQPHRHTDF